jgi:predicted nucleotidyltransferase
MDRVQLSPNLIYSVGTQIVTLRDITDAVGLVRQPRGSVGTIVTSPADLQHAYRIRFADGTEESLSRHDVTMLAAYQEGMLANPHVEQLYDRVIYRCIIGSRAYGLDDDQSDTDYRGIFLPTAEQHWSLTGVPDQLERQETQEHYWELQRFLVLALKANPNVLEALYSPLVEMKTSLAEELLGLRSIFLSKLVFQTFNGYVMSQFRKMQADVRNKGAVKPKHAMHLIRLLISGIGILREGVVPVRVTAHRERLLAIKRSEMPEAEREVWRLSLHSEFDQAFAETTLPERPDYERANAFLIHARRMALAETLP